MRSDNLASKYVDTTAIIQVIGCAFNNPSLLDDNKYVITDEDFADEFHRTVFGAIYKLHELGAKEITLETISDFFSSRPKSETIYKKNKGEEWLRRTSESANELSFNYYYGRLKKFSLLRAYDNCGVDVTEVYDPDNIFDTTKKQEQENILDNSSLELLADKIDGKIQEIRLKFADGVLNEAQQAGEGIDDLIDLFKETPEVGIPLYGPLINTVTRGARLKKFYLRSAPTSLGKTRSMVADACNFACRKIYDESFGWLDLGAGQPTLFITTEQELSEVQTMMLAFLSGVNEEHILNGVYELGEEERVKEAAEELKSSPLYVEEMPDFSLEDVENAIKKGIREHGIKYICHDYIHSSMKILSEIATKAGGIKLREDNILFMLSNKLKDLCNQYGVFIISATQLSGDFNNAETPDQNLLRGAKSIADKIDVGEIMLAVKPDDLAALEQIISTNGFEPPNLKISVYKNRRGRYKGIYLWCKADLGICRIKPMFATTYTYDMVSIDDVRIRVEDEKPPWEE